MAANYDAHSPPPVYIWGRLLKQCSSTLCSILVNLLLLINIIYTCMLISNYESTKCKYLLIALVIVKITLNVIVRQMPLNVS
jgi:hypothetical protein